MKNRQNAAVVGCEGLWVFSIAIRDAPYMCSFLGQSEVKAERIEDQKGPPITRVRNATAACRVRKTCKDVFKKNRDVEVDDKEIGNVFGPAETRPIRAFMNRHAHRAVTSFWTRVPLRNVTKDRTCSEKRGFTENKCSAKKSDDLAVAKTRNNGLHSPSYDLPPPEEKDNGSG